MVGNIIKGSDHFFNVKYVGNGGGQKTGRFVPFTDNGTISKSCVFDDGDTPRLYRQISAGNRKTYTISLWFKLGKTPSTDGAAFWSTSPSNDSGYGGNPSPYNMQFFQFSSGALEIQDYNESGNHYIFRKKTYRTFEDTSKWYHLVMAVNTPESTAADRVKIYIDGDQITSFNDSSGAYGYPDQDENTSANQNTYYDVINIGYDSHWDGYMAEFNFVDGSALTPSTFGLTDTSTGRWIPKSLTGITYGTNGYRLTFANNAGQTIGDDTSGNGNDFTVINLAASDVSTDTPTSNYTKMSDNYHAGATNTITQGGRRMQPATGSDDGTFFDMKFKTGKWYCEFYAHSADAVAQYIYNGIADFEKYVTDGVQEIGKRTHTYALDTANFSGRYYAEGSSVRTGVTSAITQGDIGGIAMDFDNNKIFFSINGTFVASSDPVAGTGGLNFAPAKDTVSGYYMLGQSNGTGSSGYNNDVSWNVGDNPTFNGTLAVGAAANTDGFGSTFKYTPPDGFKGLSFDNQPDEGVKPDFVWIKNRDASDGHQLYDSSRGPLKEIHSDSNAVESTTDDGLQRFIAGGCQIEDDVSVNTIDEKYVSWNWVANGGTTAANTDGSGASIASTTQANQTAGFSIVQWTGSGSNGTVAHGLSQAPDWIMIKNLTASGQSWHVYLNIPFMGNNRALFLDTNATYSSSSEFFNDTDPTNKVFSVGISGGVNQSTKSMLAYCWHEVEGYSKFGAYLGNQNADGPFIYTGFKPSWVMIKRYSTTGEWFILDRERNPTNTGTKEYLDADTTDSGGSLDAGAIDWLSNGFKLRQNSSQINNGTHAFMAFAEHPFNGDGENAFATAL